MGLLPPEKQRFRMAWCRETSAENQYSYQKIQRFSDVFCECPLHPIPLSVGGPPFIGAHLSNKTPECFHANTNLNATFAK